MSTTNENQGKRDDQLNGDFWIVEVCGIIGLLVIALLLIKPHFLNG